MSGASVSNIAGTVQGQSSVTQLQKLGASDQCGFFSSSRRLISSAWRGTLNQSSGWLLILPLATSARRRRKTTATAATNALEHGADIAKVQEWLAGVSYSTARSWFNLPGFPAFRGVIFWQDFVTWRTGQNFNGSTSRPPQNGGEVAAAASFPARAAQILLQG